MTSEVPLLDALFEHLDEYVVVTTRGTIVRANHTFAALLGKIPGDLVGHSLQSLIAAEDHPLLETLLAHEAAAGSAGPAALRLQAPDGSRRAIGWRACQVMVEDRPATMLIGRESSDGWQGAAEGGAWIAEVPAKQVASAEQSETIERLERQLRETRSALETMNRDLQSLDRLKADLVSTISHELRTPLVSVRGYADMLTTGRLGPLSDKQRHAVEVLLRNIDRLIHIIEKILTYSALENEQLPLQFQSVNLNTALASVARLN
ncbi:MAG TPA: histidine kinase dimerization/phospho-acceptor domain-containing protein, partial [Ardenticatenaceae bacterium]|nr:histidine kinase dimerization/phospho-acceptor domain-containing protein [Ardenticatenaceae bacterium]